MRVYERPLDGKVPLIRARQNQVRISYIKRRVGRVGAERRRCELCLSKWKLNIVQDLGCGVGIVGAEDCLRAGAVSQVIEDSKSAAQDCFAPAFGIQQISHADARREVAIGCLPKRRASWRECRCRRLIQTLHRERIVPFASCGGGFNSHLTP